VRAVVYCLGTFSRSKSSKSWIIVNHISDESLIKTCLAGQTEAFGLLVDRYQTRLFYSLLHLLGSTEDAQDVAQDAFVQAFEKLVTFRGQSQFYSWLFRIAFNTAVSAKRKSKRMKVSLDGQRDASGQELSDHRPSSAPSYAMDVCDRQRVVRQALDELSEEFRTALVLKEIDGMSYEEIADVVDVPLGTVRSRIHRARLELREKLASLLKSEVL
jgi:RNA polymerase sigma-70 factor (ECF subfamily)